MLARLSRTLSTNVAIAGLTALVLGAGGATASLAAGHSPTPNPDTAKATATESEAPDTEDATEPTEAPDAEGQDTGTRPTDTHGYCVSQVAKTAPVAPTGTGTDTVNHGSLVSAAAHACGKTASASASPDAKASKAAKTNHGKAYGRNHGTGRPATVTPGTAPAH